MGGKTDAEKTAHVENRGEARTQPESNKQKNLTVERKCFVKKKRKKDVSWKGGGRTAHKSRQDLCAM